MENRPSPPHCRALWLLLLTPVVVGLVACTQAVENKQVNKPLTSLDDVGAPVVHVASGLRFPSTISGWSRMFVSPQEVKQPVVKLSYNSGLRRVGTSSYGLERTATITLFPAEGRSVDDVMNLQVARVQRQYTGDEAAPLKTAIGNSVWVSYFNAKRGWHMGREICVVPHQGYMVVYEVGGTKGQFEEGYSQVESLTGVIHGLKK